MHINLKIDRENKVNLSLREEKRIIDNIEWKEGNSLSRFLLLKIEQILKKNKIGLDKISGYKIISDVPKKWTSYRIAEITLKSILIALSNAA